MTWQVSQDIIVVKGNPLFNIVALAGVEVVVNDGSCTRAVPEAGGG